MNIIRKLFRDITQKSNKLKQDGYPIIGDTAIELEDGRVIQYSSIQEIGDGTTVIGAPDNPLIRAINTELEQGRGVVYLLYVTKNGPSTLVISVENHSESLSIIEQIKSAKKSANKQTSPKIIVGECAVCNRKIRVREHAIKEKMKLTCKCGNLNEINIPN